MIVGNNFNSTGLYPGGIIFYLYSQAVMLLEWPQKQMPLSKRLSRMLLKHFHCRIYDDVRSVFFVAVFKDNVLPGGSGYFGFHRYSFFVEKNSLHYELPAVRLLVGGQFTLRIP